MGKKMKDRQNKKEFQIQGRSFVLQKVKGELKSLQRMKKEQLIEIECKSENLEFEIPWHAEVQEGDELEVIYSYDKEDGEPKIVLYMYNLSKKRTEVNERFPKPEKGILMVVLDFVLIIGLGFASSPIIGNTIEEKGMTSGLIVLFGMIAVMFFLVSKMTYQIFFKKHLQEIEDLDSFVRSQHKKE